MTKPFTTVHLFLVHQGRILLVRQASNAPVSAMYTVITDHLKDNEQVIVGAIRIIQEQAGIEVSADNIEIVGLMCRNNDEQQRSFYLAATISPVDVKVSTEQKLSSCVVRPR